MEIKIMIDIENKKICERFHSISGCRNKTCDLSHHVEDYFKVPINLFTAESRHCKGFIITYCTKNGILYRSSESKFPDDYTHISNILDDSIGIGEFQYFIPKSISLLWQETKLIPQLYFFINNMNLSKDIKDFIKSFIQVHMSNLKYVLID
jgi:hypothetical protein